MTKLVPPKPPIIPGLLKNSPLASNLPVIQKGPPKPPSLPKAPGSLS